MRTSIFRNTLLTITALGCAGLLTGCKEAAPPPPPPMVEVADAGTTNVPVSIEFIGQLDSPQNVEVRARVEAFVEKMPFTDGTEVKEGDLLFVLDSRPYKERLAAAQGAMAEANAALNKYEKDVARLRPLAEKRAVPQQDLDNAIAAVEVGKAAVLTAKARVQSAELDLSYCEVRAPMAGLIGAKQVSIGELVGKGTPTLMATMSTLDPIWFYCNVSEVQYLRAETESQRSGKQVADLPVTLILSDGTVHPNGGKFVFIDRAVDVKTGTLRVRAEFANPNRILRPGMFARVKVDLGTKQDAILVPERAIVELQGKNFIWVVGPDNKASQRSIKLGNQFNGSYNVTEGLKAGEKYIVAGVQKVREGATVQPMTAAQMAQAAAKPAPAPATEKE